MVAPDAATFEFVRYLERAEQADTRNDETVRDTDGMPMILGELYWEAEGQYVPANPNSMHRYLDDQAEDYGTPIDWDYDHLAGILEDYKSAEVITWMN